MVDQPGRVSADHQIRPATSEDRPAVLAFCAQTWDDEPDFIARVYDAWLAEGGLHVGTDGSGLPVALLNLRMLAPGEAWFGGLRVARSARRQGWGNLLISTALAWARERGARTLGCLTHAANAPMQALLPQLGFAPHGQVVWHSWDVPETAGSESLLAAEPGAIDLGRAERLREQAGYYAITWYLRRLSEARLAEHALRDELPRTADGRAWAIIAPTGQAQAHLAHLEGDEQGLAALLAALPAHARRLGYAHLTALLPPQGQPAEALRRSGAVPEGGAYIHYFREL